MTIELHFRDGSYSIVEYVQSFRLRSELVIIDAVEPFHEFKFARESLDFFKVLL